MTKKATELMFPYSREAEEGVLGSLLIDPDAIAQVVELLRPQDFYRDAHARIYAAMLSLFERHSPADMITLCEELERGGALAEVGGVSTVTSLINAVPTSGNVVFYAQIVAQKALYRRLIHVSGDIAAAAYAEETDALAQAEQAIFALAARGQVGDAEPLAVILGDCMTQLEAVQNHTRSVIGVPTGFRHLDIALGGLHRADLVILAARPGTGKTAFALNVASNAAMQSGRRVAFFSLEMSQQQLGTRLMAMHARIDQQRLRLGLVYDEEWERLVEAMTTLSAAPLWIDDTGGLSLATLRSKARRLQAGQGIDLVIVDYLQLMHATLEGKRYPNREQEIAEISRGLKGLAKELDVPVLALAQLSRAVESRHSKIPQLSDLRESGAIENDADVVLFIYREEMYNSENLDVKNTADIIIAKHRNGPVGTVRLGFEASQTRFYSIEYTPLGEEEE